MNTNTSDTIMKISQLEPSSTLATSQSENFKFPNYLTLPEFVQQLQ